MKEHGAMRPSWRCAGCGSPWPCPAARRRLLTEYQGATVSLALYMGACFIDAAVDLSDAAAGPLHDQFLGWLREARLGPLCEVP